LCASRGGVVAGGRCGLYGWHTIMAGIVKSKV